MNEKLLGSMIKDLLLGKIKGEKRSKVEGILEKEMVEFQLQLKELKELEVKRPYDITDAILNTCFAIDFRLEPKNLLNYSLELLRRGSSLEEVLSEIKSFTKK